MLARDPFVRWLDVLGHSNRWTPAVSILQDNDGCKLLIDMPGVSKEALSITHDSGVLSIEGERSNPDPKDLVRQDQLYGRFKHRFTVPNSLDVERIAASLKDGVLAVTLPPREASKAIAISVD